jgi:hypothetical protein
MQERGIIAPISDINFLGPFITMGKDVSPQLVRYFLLYWDKIVLTDTSIIKTELFDDDFKMLENIGILEKITAAIDKDYTVGKSMVDIHYKGQAEIASKLMRENPGRWAVHQTGDHLIIPEDMSVELITADFELIRCLPVPKQDISLDAVLEFKNKRHDELLALRSTLDEMYVEISKSSDIPRSKNLQIIKLEKAISDLDKVAKQSWGERILASRKVSLDLNMDSLKNGALTGICVGQYFSSILAGFVSGLSGTLFSSIKFEISVSPQLDFMKGQQIDLSYISSVKKEHIAN